MAHLNQFPYSFHLSPYWDPTSLCCTAVWEPIQISRWGMAHEERNRWDSLQSEFVLPRRRGEHASVNREADFLWAIRPLGGDVEFSFGCHPLGTFKNCVRDVRFESYNPRTKECLEGFPLVLSHYLAIKGLVEVQFGWLGWKEDGSCNGFNIHDEWYVTVECHPNPTLHWLIRHGTVATIVY